MALRVTELEVKAILDTAVSDSQVLAFLTTANVWIDANLLGQGLSDAILTEIEKYLGAHLVTLRDPRLKRVRLDDVDETYQRDGEVTEYLLTAMALDPTGKLEGAFKPPEGKTALQYRIGTGFVEEAETEVAS